MKMTKHTGKEAGSFKENRYSSRDMERETGLSNEGLRFYEKKGILQVEKDAKTGYRTYPIMKVPMLRSVRILNSYGISLDRIAGLIKEHDHHAQALGIELDRAKARMEWEIEWKKRCMRCLEEQRETLSHPIGEIYFEELEEQAYLEYHSAEWLKTDDELRKLVDKWLQNMPIVQPTPHLPQKDIGADRYCPAGLMVRYADLAFLGLADQSPVRILPKGMVVCRVFTQEAETNILAEEALKPLIEFTKNTGLAISGDALFRCVSFESFSAGEGKLYYKVMVPVKIRRSSK